MRKVGLLALLLGLICAVSQPVLGQSQQQSSDLVDLLERLSRQFDVTFNYSVKRMESLEVNLSSQVTTLPEILEELSRQLPLEFRPFQEDGYAVIPIFKPLNFQVNDASDDTPIDLIYVTINRNKYIHLLPKAGIYTLNNSFPTDSLEIRTSFYQPIYTTAGEISRSGGKVALEQDTFNLGEVTIMDYLTSGVTTVLGDHRVEVNMKDLSLLAGETDGDIFQVLQAIPGLRSSRRQNPHGHTLGPSA